ncbi:MAG: leucyl/phenylalanyl-tRNA--protein transferase, partial [Gammaproteobacteria bacterium]
HLCRLLGNGGYRLIDCQIHTPHLERLGARRISRRDFETMLHSWVDQPASPSAWQHPGRAS